MSEIEKAVQKATDSKHTAPKRKHVRNILSVLLMVLRVLFVL